MCLKSVVSERQGTTQVRAYVLAGHMDGLQGEAEKWLPPHIWDLCSNSQVAALEMTSLGESFVSEQKEEVGSAVSSRSRGQTWWDSPTHSSTDQLGSREKMKQTGAHSSEEMTFPSSCNPIPVVFTYIASYCACCKGEIL